MPGEALVHCEIPPSVGKFSNLESSLEASTIIGLHKEEIIYWELFSTDPHNEIKHMPGGTSIDFVDAKA